MLEQDNLSRDIILDHAKNPRNNGIIEPSDIKADGLNPLCNDQITLTLNISDDKISNIKFTGHGCAISQSSTSIMTEIVKGKNLKDIEKIADIFKDMMLKNGNLEHLKEFEEDEELIENLESFVEIKKYPLRIKCATLGWNTLITGIKENIDK